MDLTALNSFFQSIINQLLPEPQASLLKGVLLGVKDLPPDLKENLKITGTLHVVVVSGYNISVVSGIFLSLSGFLKRSTAIILSLLAIILYTTLVGFEPPVVRAAIMAFVTYLAVFLGRQKLALYSLFLAGFIMFLFDFSILTNVSFQLSFLATLGITLFGDSFNLYLKFLPNPFREALSVSLAAQLLVTPVIFYNFGTVSLISPLVNSLVLWTIPLATILGFIALIVGSMFLVLGQVVALFVWAALSIFLWVVEITAKIPLAQIEVGRDSWVMVLGWYLIVVGIYIFSKEKESVELQKV